MRKYEIPQNFTLSRNPSEFYVEPQKRLTYKIYRRADLQINHNNNKGEQLIVRLALQVGLEPTTP